MCLCADLQKSVTNHLPGVVDAESVAVGHVGNSWGCAVSNACDEMGKRNGVVSEVIFE